jgi:DNA-binding LacI/PurR family transcriptional regulator
MTTMVDVARKAGVALSTVSHTLSGKRPVSAQLKKRVLKAMEELDYQPHAVGQALRNKRTKTIGMLYPSSASGLSLSQLEFVSGAAEIATERGYALYLWSAPDKDEEILRMVQQGIIDGLILMEIKLHDPRISMLKERNYPFVMVGHAQEGENEGISFVDIDFEYAIRTSVEYLAEQGHQTIAFVNTDVALERGLAYAHRARLGFDQAVAGCGLKGVNAVCSPDAQSGYKLIRTILRENSSLSAVVTLNTWIIASMMRAIYESGLSIPNDFAFAGIMSSQLAEMLTPTLTAINFPHTMMGRTAAEFLIQQLDEEDFTIKQRLLKPELIVRQSTGPYRRVRHAVSGDARNERE